MDTISIRYGEHVTLPVDAGDTAYVRAELFIGILGETLILSSATDLEDGQGVFVLSSEETQIPLGTYNYQINVYTGDDLIEKFPSPNCDSCTLPKFIVCDALDLQEVVS